MMHAFVVSGSGALHLAVCCFMSVRTRVLLMRMYHGMFFFVGLGGRPATQEACAVVPHCVCLRPCRDFFPGDSDRLVGVDSNWCVLRACVRAFCVRACVCACVRECVILVLGAACNV